MNDGVSERLYHVTVNGSPSGQWLTFTEAFDLRNIVMLRDPEAEVLIEEEK